MHRYAMGFGVTIALLSILGIFAFTQLEIYQKSQPVSPSREALANAVLAMERWLTKTGHSVRIEPSGDPQRVKAAREQTVFIQASCFDWSDTVRETLEPWVAAGGVLIISVDSPWRPDLAEGPAAFLTYLGIQRLGFKDQDDETNQETPMKIEEPTPDFDWEVSFKVTWDTIPKTITGIETMSSRDGVIRLVRLSLGRGSITIMGVPYFMYFDSLRKEENARLSWNLLCTHQTEPGILFIRDKKLVKSFWGKLAQRGNLLALGVSIMVLLVIGFWMVIPVFGRLLEDQGKPGKPIQERFLAEARFLKKYGALETYLGVYIQEIKLRIRKRGGFHTDTGEASVQKLAAQITALVADSSQSSAFVSPCPFLGDLANVLDTKKNLGSRDFVKRITILQTILDRL